MLSLKLWTMLRILAISFYFEDLIQNIEPVPFINGEQSLINDVIKENDDIELVITRF
ncbi:hypothetical protein G9F73_012795 [Clostridium estertheticum]|uniref:hypothetical protein n=1 Tax=Clostridium estertheticum TaxID=238834 RepID=UPI0013EEA2D6|nr:hypothetical protein [Clostridium estertheticum]MBZ9608686.1 hypothetical protein [Clostridium estertheticum]